MHINASRYQPTHINACGDYCSIIIGDGCLISNNVEIHTTDYHKIYDKSQKLLNKNKNVYIGKNVWLGLGVTILKGSFIPNGTIVGAKTLIAGKLEDNNTVVCGSPCRVIKRDCFWCE